MNLALLKSEAISKGYSLYTYLTKGVCYWYGNIHIFSDIKIQYAGVCERMRYCQITAKTIIPVHLVLLGYWILVMI